MSLLVGIHIQSVLTADENVAERVQNRVYPIVVPEGVPAYPFIVYQVDGTTENRTKDGMETDTASVSVMVVAKTYGEATKIANYARYALEMAGVTKYEEFEVRKCTLSGSSETYESSLPAYGVMLSLDFETLDY